MQSREMEHSMDKQAWTIQQVAEFLNVNPRTVYRLVQAGKLPGFKVAGSWRFLEEDIRAWVNEQKQQVPPTRHRNRKSK